ncbi:MAG: hypothetical protein EB127_07575 [Alphaproteobacteria bacterium]|nr:hypothetical protein [Alphaproteobacteria bacterium]
MITLVDSTTAFNMLNKLNDSVIVDTRTEEEWINIGYPLLENKVFLISSHIKPDMSLSPEFIPKLKDNFKNQETGLFFICRTSGRATVAAHLAEEFGYQNCFIVSDGFEGSEAGPGWKNNNLPFCYKK